MIEVAEKFGTAPHLVMKWPLAWFRRALLVLNARALAQKDIDQKARKEAQKRGVS